MTALKKAVEVWNNPQEMIDMWDIDPNKTSDEKTIADIVGDAGHLVDLGCGVGRYADVLDYQSYIGYDGSVEMISRAGLSRPEELLVEFCCIDIINFQIPEHTFDTAILIDVAHHQENPTEFTRQILNLWKAKRFIFTFAVGISEERLFASHIISKRQLDDFINEVNASIVHSRQDDPFSWVVVESIQ